MNFKGILAIIGTVTAGAIAASPPSSHRGARQGCGGIFGCGTIQSQYDNCMNAVVPENPTTAQAFCGGTDGYGTGCATTPGCIAYPATHYGYVPPAPPLAQQVAYDDCMLDCVKSEANKVSPNLNICQPNCGWKSNCTGSLGNALAPCVIHPYSYYYTSSDSDYFTYLSQCFMGSLAWPIDRCRNSTYSEFCVGANPPCVVAATPVPLDNSSETALSRVNSCKGVCARFTNPSTSYTRCTKACDTYICCSSKCGTTTAACSGHYFSIDYPTF